MSVKQVLIDARALVAAGWTKGEFFRVVDGQDCYCMVGAVLGAAPPGDDRANAWDELAWEIRRTTEFPGATFFNDDPATTQDDVLAMFDRVIEAQP